MSYLTYRRWPSVQWRIVYFVAPDAVVILDVFSKKTETTPAAVIKTCRLRMASYRRAVSEKKG